MPSPPHNAATSRDANAEVRDVVLDGPTELVKFIKAPTEARDFSGFHFELCVCVLAQTKDGRVNLHQHAIGEMDLFDNSVNSCPIQQTFSHFRRRSNRVVRQQEAFILTG